MNQEHKDTTEHRIAPERGRRPGTATGESHADAGPSLESALRGAIRGFEVLDRDLVLPNGEGPRHVDLIGVDSTGRLVLVVVAERADEAALLCVLSALSFAREARTIAARHWRGARVTGDTEPLVVLVAREIPASTADALSFLPPTSSMVLESRLLETRGGGLGYLVRRDLRGARRDAPRSVPELLASWPEATRERARALTVRVQRIDPELTMHVEDEALRWSWRDADVGALACSDGRLVADGANGEPPVPIVDDAACEAWLEHVLLAHCARIGGSARSPRPLDVLQRSSAPLLTAEEIAAFRDG